MSGPLINLLIRTAGRPKQFARCIESVANQTYKNVRCIISVESDADHMYVRDTMGAYDLDYRVVIVEKHSIPYGYNLHCNDLIECVREGWFMFLDDDDKLADDGSLGIAQVLDKKPIIFQFQRGESRKKPSDEHMRSKSIVRGKIGMPCIIVPHGISLPRMTATEDADYRWIQEINRVHDCEWLPVVIVSSPRRGHGKPE